MGVAFCGALLYDNSKGGNRMEQIRLSDGSVLEYEWAVRPVRRLNLRVRPDGSVQVTAGRRFSRRQVEAFVAANAGWIAAARARMARRIPVALPQRLGDGDRVRWLGQELPVAVLAGETETARLAGGRIELCCAGDAEQAAALYRRWFTEESGRLLERMLREAYLPFAAAGVAFPRLQLKYLRSRWGSCTAATGRISLNRLLCQLPEELIRLVICHELTHFLHPDHSGRFYRALEQVYPGAREAGRALREFALL